MELSSVRLRERERERTGRRRQIIAYDAWRGIAALKIVCGHMTYLGAATSPFWLGLWQHFLRFSGCTTFFMVCSGFFLQYTWKERAFGAYLKGKLKRIYPLVMLVFLMALAVDLFINTNVVSEGVDRFSPQWFFNIVANVFLFKAFIPVEGTFYSFHGPSWYITVLVWLYVIGYPIVKRLHSDTETPEGRAVKHKTLVFVTVICAFAYVLEIVLCVLFKIKGWPSLYVRHINPFFRICGEGFLGILICEKQDVIIHKTDELVDHLHISYTVLELISVSLFLLDFIIAYYVKISFYHNVLQLIPMGFILVAFRQEKGAVSRVLSTRPFLFLGTISFELYMTHAFVYEGLPISVGIVSASMKSWLITHAGTRFLITMVLCIVFAWIVHVLLEAFNKKVLARS